MAGPDYKALGAGLGIIIFFVGVAWLLGTFN